MTSANLKLLTRAEIPEIFQWNKESIFPTAEAWEEAFSDLNDSAIVLESFRDFLSKDAEKLLGWFHAYENVMGELGKIVTYAHMEFAVETTNQSAVDRMNRARSLAAKINTIASFSDPEILGIDPTQLKSWLENETNLKAYEHYLEHLENRRRHVRSEEVEELLGLVVDPFRTARTVHGILADADLTFEDAVANEGNQFEVAHGTIGALLSSPDRKVRQTAWENYADGFLGMKNGMANCIAAGVKQNVFNARARRYASALEAALAPNHIPVQVFHNLIDTFKSNLSVWHRYWRLRREALGYDRFHVYDIKAPLYNSRIEITFQQAVDWIAEGMSPLGREYTELLKRGVETQRWVDIYPNKGKRSGAFSTGSPGTFPFILMSYNNDIFSMSTLAHELGHSMHSFYAWKNQPFVYGNYSLFVAEVASNFNQAMVRAYLLRTQTDRDFQIAILEEAMSNFHRYFLIMPTLARFELEIHERIEHGKALTAEILMDLMADLFSEAYGSEVEMDKERVGITWAQFPNHLYANFYVFQYATGISGAHALVNSVLRGDSGAADRYLDFLKAGGSSYALDALREAGVDLQNPEPVEETFELLSSYVDRLENLLHEN